MFENNSTKYLPPPCTEQLPVPAEVLRAPWYGYEAGPESSGVPLSSYLWILRRHLWKIFRQLRDTKQEILDGKKFSEDTLGHEVISFCYPGGKYNRRIEEDVREAGFLAGRTCRYFLNDYPKNPFSWDISTYANTYPAYVQVRHCLLESNFAGAYKYLTTFKSSVPWITQFVCALEDVSRNGGMAHLYFHSWEIDQNGEWDKLELMFKTIVQYKLTAVTNGFLFRKWHEKFGAVRTPALVSSTPQA